MGRRRAQLRLWSRACAHPTHPHPPPLVTHSLRHCDYVASVDPTAESADFQWTVVAALSGAPFPSVSLASANFNDRYLVPIAGGNVGANQNPDHNDASWLLAPWLAGGVNATSIKSLSKGAYGGMYRFWSTAHAAPCGGGGDVQLASGAAAARSSFYLGAPPPPPPPPPAAITVAAGTILSTLPETIKGCHSDEGFMHQSQFDAHARGFVVGDAALNTTPLDPELLELGEDVLGRNTPLLRHFRDPLRPTLRVLYDLSDPPRGGRSPRPRRASRAARGTKARSPGNLLLPATKSRSHSPAWCR